jgi:Fic family protein
MTLTSKLQRLTALRPLSPESVASLAAAWDVRMVYESNSIEGNSLTLRETELVLSKGVTVSGKPLKDHLEAVNLAKAWERVKELAQAETDHRAIQREMCMGAFAIDNTPNEFAHLSWIDLLLIEQGIWPNEFIDDTQPGFVDRRKEVLAYAKAQNAKDQATPHPSANSNPPDRSENCPCLTERDLLDLHRIILTRVEDSFAGTYRSSAVRIAGSNHTPPNPIKVPDLMASLFADSESICDPIEKAARLHHGIASIHPFADGNGRTARLAMNFVLLAAGYPPISIPVSPREAYYNALEAADSGDFPTFRAFLETELHKELDHYLEALQQTQDTRP